jgi:hypothetical protein
VAQWSFNGAAVSGGGENGEGERGVGEMKGAAAPIHFTMGGEGALHSGGEQAAMVLSREAVGWLKVEEDGKGFEPSGPRCWAQSKKWARRLDEPPWPGGPRWAVVMAGRKNEKKTGNNRWASREHRPN